MNRIFKTYVTLVLALVLGVAANVTAQNKRTNGNGKANGAVRRCLDSRCPWPKILFASC